MIRRPATDRTDDAYVSDEEEAVVAPKRRTKRTDDDEDDAPVRRVISSADHDEDDDAPVAPRRTIKRGWAAAEAVKATGTGYAQVLKLAEEPQIVKFLEDEPYASYRQHWVERSGQKSWVCIDDIDPKGCPLCEIGNRAGQRFNFNVVLLGFDGERLVKSYEVGPRVIDQLKNFHTDQRQGPLTKHYWAISRTGKGTNTATNHQMVRERDLDEFDLEPLTESELKALAKKAYTDEVIKIPTRKELLAIAEDL
jgi:hypothetical protein